ncbi:hypothetical protein O3M35_001535 [Rhynocoris fuscipes]|uniref:Thymidylate kinase-like domain-containing protein n=1 Tax=Rhynocoris fuscipes TaxID=488301 RepID=A0AAW1CNU2_9HEMI
MVAYNVYKSLEQILDYLREPSVQCDEVKELLSIYDKSKTRWTSDVHPVKLFLVFEGLDGSGKSTMTKLASKKLSCVQVVTPPDCIKHLRNYFDECEPKLRRAYYSLGNYIAAMEIRTILQTRPVVMDRFWHSTAAYAIAESSDDIPS